MATSDTPKLPGSFKRFVHATGPHDESVEFYESSGTFTGRNLAPPRRQGEPYQKPYTPREGE